MIILRALPLAILAGATPTWAATPIAGRYLTEDGAGIVQVAPCGASTCGRLVQILKAERGAPTTDVNNRDPLLRGRPIQGIAILSGFADRDADWRGTIYDPRNGKSYKSIVNKNADGSLKVQGCIAISVRRSAGHQHANAADERRAFGVVLGPRSGRSNGLRRSR